LYHDIIFNQEILDKILRCNSDVCSAHNTQNIIKWSKKGMEELIKILDEKEMRNHEGNMSYPVWGKIRWNNNISWLTFWGGFLFNICNDDDYIRLKEMYK